jgi:hypothetical protein
MELSEGGGAHRAWVDNGARKPMQGHPGNLMLAVMPDSRGHEHTLRSVLWKRLAAPLSTICKKLTNHWGCASQSSNFNRRGCGTPFAESSAQRDP